MEATEIKTEIKQEEFFGHEKSERKHSRYILTTGHKFKAKLWDSEVRDKHWTEEMTVKRDLLEITADSRVEKDKKGTWATHYYISDISRQNDPEDKMIYYRGEFHSAAGTQISFDKDQLNEKDEKPERIEITPKTR